ncbi:hypothetical protein R1sor_000750 [Riccia sorocarpa]|uniref:Uncharacterized protein n=1 Tax=Riccia sorocarpa TaxID=122646 RepID=A0ABD3GU20_9MARC
MAGSLESWPASDVQGKIALVYGGEGDEGLKLAREFVVRGCRVVLIESTLPESSRPLPGQTVADPLPHFVAFPCSGVDGNEAAVLDSVRRIELDVTAGEEVYSRVVEQSWAVFGRIDILINCNSVPATLKPFLDTTEKDYDRIMDINVKSSWKLSKAVARKMREAEKGKYGIRVNAVSAGLTTSNDLFQAKSEESVQELARQVVPLQRWSNFPEDIMGIVLWLASDLSIFVTGTISVVDGGQSLSRPRLSSFL